MQFSSRYDVDDFFAEAVALGASDLHLEAFQLPYFRIHGKLTPFGHQVLTPDNMESIVNFTFESKVGAAKVQARNEIDYSYEMAPRHQISNTTRNTMRFRVNVAETRVGLYAVLRALPVLPPEPEALGVPPHLTEYVLSQRKGLVLLCGITGSGKTSTLASWLHAFLKRERDLNIITLEHPIEYVYDDVEDRVSIIHQREIGLHTESFAMGLRAALREDPDILLVGEMRDPETIQAALTAVDTGHLVLSTVHSDRVANTPNRMVDVLPESERSAYRAKIINAMRLIVHQSLWSAVGGGRVASHEYLIFSEEIRADLLEQESAGLISAIQDRVDRFGQSASVALSSLYRAARIDAEEYRQSCIQYQCAPVNLEKS